MGPEPVPQKRLTIERLTAAIRAVTEDEGARRRAEELGERVRGEDSVARAVELIERTFAERVAPGGPCEELYRTVSSNPPFISCPKYTEVRVRPL
jgi:hypothetical protein